MKKYISFKLVDAEPAYRHNGTIYPKTGAYPKAMVLEDGYKLQYPDGYVSFCPKDIFEKSYLEVQRNEALPSGVSIGPEMVESFIDEYHISTSGKKTTVVRAELVNGFEIVESSSCVDTANYSEEIGAEICKERIRNKVWGYLGFMLQTAFTGIKK